jgi:hypothetical protein
LFLAALGVSSRKLGRAFALVELLRSEAAFAVSPIVLFVMSGLVDPGDPLRGVHVGLQIMLVLACAGFVLSLAIPAVSGARLRAPDLHAWLDDGEQALPSPITAVHLRPRTTDHDAEPLLPRGRRPN